MIVFFVLVFALVSSLFVFVVWPKKSGRRQSPSPNVPDLQTTGGTTGARKGTDGGGTTAGGTGTAAGGTGTAAGGTGTGGGTVGGGTTGGGTGTAAGGTGTAGGGTTSLTWCKGKMRSNDGRKDDPANYKNAFLEGHNHYRKLHKVDPLVWDDRLEQVAKDYAAKCKFEHSDLPYGENLAQGTFDNVASVVDTWYKEHKDWYILPRPLRSTSNTGHFTQLVWKGTKRVGCAVNKACSKPLYVCQYDPPGNWPQHYTQNVFCQNSTDESNPPNPNYVHPTVRTPPPPPPPPPTGPCGFVDNRPENGNDSIALDDREAVNRQFLSDHNHYRRLHGIPELKRDARLEASAQTVADKCVFEHSGVPYGENLATGYPGPTSVTNAWYDEHSLYDRNNPRYSPDTGHFTQMMWYNRFFVGPNHLIGCAAKNCPGGVKDGGRGKNLYVCHYWPRGNVQGQYNANVSCRQ